MRKRIFITALFLLILSQESYSQCEHAESALESYRNTLAQSFNESRERATFFTLRQLEAGKSVQNCRGATSYFGSGHCADLSTQLDSIFKNMNLMETSLSRKIDNVTSDAFMEALSDCPKNTRAYYLSRFEYISEKYAELHSVLQSSLPEIWNPTTQKGLALLRLASPKTKPARFVELLPRAITDLDAYIVKMRLLGAAFQLKTSPAQARISDDAELPSDSQSEVR